MTYKDIFGMKIAMEDAGIPRVKPCQATSSIEGDLDEHLLESQ